MALEINHYESHFPDEQTHKVPLEEMEPTYATWVGHLNREYRLYNVYPAMYNLPPVFVYSAIDNNVDIESGVVSAEEEMLGLGRIDGAHSPLPESIISNLDVDEYGPEITLDSGGASLRVVTTLENIICDLSSDAENLVSVEGDLLTLSFSDSAISKAFEIYPEYDSDVLESLFDELVDDEDYPLSHIDDVDGFEEGEADEMDDEDQSGENGDGDVDTYIYQAKFRLSEVEHNGINFTPVFYEAIDDHYRGVFVDEPELAFLYNVARVSDLSYQGMADMFGVDENRLIQSIDGASDLVARSHRTSRKYTNGGNEM